MHRLLEPILVFVWLCFATVLVWTSAASNSEKAQTEFEKISEDGAENIRSRVILYQQVIEASAAHLGSVAEPDQDTLTTFLSRWDLKKDLPGITSISWVVPVADRQIDQFLHQMREDVGEAFHIHPHVDVKDHYILRAIYPKEGNEKALGLDLAFEGARREAIAQSLQTGQPRMTARVILVQDDEKNPGFVLLAPIRQVVGDLAPGEEGQRGWVAAAFVGKNVLADVSTHQGRSYNLQVFDGLDADADKLIYDGRIDAESSGRYIANHTIEEFGRPWAIRFESTAEFEQVYLSYQPLVIAMTCIGLTGLFFQLLRSIRRRNAALREISELRSRQIDARDKETRSIIENAVVPMFILDGQAQILSLNHAAQETFGYGRDAAKGLSFRKLVEIPATRRSKEDDTTIGYTKSGRRLTLEVQYNNWSTAEGDARITAIARDVTSEREAIAALQRVKSLNDLALRGSRIGVFEVDLSTGKSEVTDTWYQVMGIDKQFGEIDTQKHFLDRIHPEDRPILENADRACIEGRSERSVTEFRMSFGDNEWRWMRSDAVVSEKDENGNATRLIGTQMDVTDLVHSRNALEASEELFRSVLESAPVGIALMDSEGGFIMANQALADLCGLDEADLVANYKLRDLLPKEDLKQVYAEVSALLKVSNTGIYSAEHRLLDGSQQERWGEFHVTWNFDKNSDSLYFIAQVVDITKRKELDRIKSEFVSTVSHELRTPLTSIKGALDLIGAKGTDKFDSATERLMGIATTNAHRLTVIVNDILDLERITAGEFDFASERVDLCEIVRSTLQELEPYAKNHGNTLTTSLTCEPVDVMVDVNRTVQILTNLLSNGCKFSDPGTEVNAKVEILDDVAIVFVQNFGPGIPEGFEEDIFKAFSQADSSDTRAAGGTGLGLNIARTLVEKQGGKIGYESIPGGVTVFWFTCPLANEIGDTPDTEFPTLLPRSVLSA